MELVANVYQIFYQSMYKYSTPPTIMSSSFEFHQCFTAGPERESSVSLGPLPGEDVLDPDHFVGLLLVPCDETNHTSSLWLNNKH